ncbi:TPA: 2,6-beta-D-fructofuranosidase [Candidatus Latescibacteria bacterium]|nr:2,6-beta-D-fructofuranosidase [Candidatus Latescibacterota bacterium]
MPYSELHRPQFHFSPRENWTNDPNGLVYYEGEYHLFFQHNPTSVKWGNMTWGHAVSTDLLHWTQLDHALEPDELGTIFSGSAVVDWNNTGGFKAGDLEPLIAFYTSAGHHADPPQPFTQSIAYSNDRGRSWTKYDGNPVIGHLRASNRDPKVVWHAPTERWILALYYENNDYALFASTNLVDWTHLQDLTLPGVTECPDFFELAVDGKTDQKKWVYWGADGGYLIGSFDGERFEPETDILKAEFGKNGYAAQTYSDIPEEDGRRIQISWMRGGKYPAMPFNQQMSIPVELRLRTTTDGVRLQRNPIHELEDLYERTESYQNVEITPNRPLIPDSRHNCFDVRVSFEPDGGERFGVIVQGHTIEYCPVEREISCFGRVAHVRPIDKRIDLRLIIDSTSLELFAENGTVVFSCTYLPEACDHPLEFFTNAGSALVASLVISEIRSIWR